TSSFASHIICTFFFFSHTAPTASYTLSLHDARPIYEDPRRARDIARPPFEEYFRALNEAIGEWERGTSKDYRDYDKSARRLRSFTLDGQIESGGAWVGTPREIKAIIRHVTASIGKFEHASLQIN